MITIANIASWKIEGLYKADANIVAKEISELGDSVSCEMIVEKARNEDTELHKCFEWRDDIAAEKYRLTQAQNVLRCLVITRAEPDKEPVKTNLRVFHNTNYHQYKSIDMAVRCQSEYERLLNTALGELKAFKEKYHMLSELEEILALID